MSAWDDEDFVPGQPTKKVSDKWDGEDEEPIKDCWEEDERKVTAAVPEKKKKKLADIIAEKEKKKYEEMQRRRKERMEEVKRMTPEGILEEKLRIKKVQEDSDLALMTDLVGEEEEEDDDYPLDDNELTNKDDLESFKKAIVNKIRNTPDLEKEIHFVNFVGELSRDLCQNLESDNVKKVSSMLNALHNEKVKASKVSYKNKKKNKLNIGKGAIADTYELDDFDDEFNDFI